jgi:hypothetical protein
MPDGASRSKHLVIAALAAFSTYFCMYAFRKPFTAATYEGLEFGGASLKAALIIAQISGYMLSKFIGIRVVSEMPRHYRAAAIVGLIVTAELALVGFAFLPMSMKVPMLFLNGLPLGMVFGLVLAFLEGRQQTEALSAALCASFIVSSGVVKSVGQWMIVDWQVDEFQMPMLTGIFFLAPLLIAVWFLNRTPLPDASDRALRAERGVMYRHQRREFIAAYWPGLVLLTFVYITLTVVRTVRDDFGVEIWRDLGVDSAPEVFAYAETTVAIVVTGLIALTVLIRSNVQAIRATVIGMTVAFALVIAASLLQGWQMLSPFTFMVCCGIGLYVPYVAFHTTVFERLIAVSNRPCNLGFLMYLADSFGYLGYVGILLLRSLTDPPQQVLPAFRSALTVAALLAIAALAGAVYYFQRHVIRDDDVSTAALSSPPITQN